jgi:hypothetical protein
MRLLKAATLALAMLLPMAALAGRDPAEPPPTPGMRWGEANAANLRAMARPADLATPAPASAGNGRLDADAVTRLLDGKVTNLLREGGTRGGADGGNGGAPQ